MNIDPLNIRVVKNGSKQEIRGVLQEIGKKVSKHKPGGPEEGPVFVYVYAAGHGASGSQ